MNAKRAIEFEETYFLKQRLRLSATEEVMLDTNVNLL